MPKLVAVYALIDIFNRMSMDLGYENGKSKQGFAFDFSNENT
jgi:hypothetical protein